MDSGRFALTFALAVFVLWRNLPGALLSVFPKLMRARGEDESWPEVDKDLFARMEEELQPLGFKRLGVHVERAPLKRSVVAYDFVHEGERTWATARSLGREITLTLLTPFDQGAFVLTADHRIQSHDLAGRCLAGGMPGAVPEQLVAAHRRRVDRLKEAGRSPLADLSLEARVRAEGEWFASFGGRELRTHHLNNLLMTLMALGLVATILWAMIKPS
ncbi:MAG TPA: hypothetical protein VGK67_15765 [Myxococcales bacterium]